MFRPSMIVLVAFLMAFAMYAAASSGGGGCGCTVASPDYNCAGLSIASITACTELASDAATL